LVKPKPAVVATPTPVVNNITAAGAVAKAIAASSRSLAIGARGTDVAALQTVLVQKGFLTIPYGVAKGYFGTLTRSAVAKYQASVGLPANGVFGSLTRTRLMAELSEVAVRAKLPSTAIITPAPSTPVSTENIAIPMSVKDSLSFPQILIQSAKSLYATPIDGLITSLLLIAILFVAFKINSR